MNFYGGSIITGSGAMTINGIKIDMDDPIGTCRRLLKLVSEEDQIDFANEILASVGNISEEQRMKNSAIVKENRSCSQFTEIHAKGSFKVFYKQGAEWSVMVEGKQKDVDKITTTCKEGALYVKMDGAMANAKTLKVVVTAPVLENIMLEGSADFVAETPIVIDDDLDVATSGSGDICIPRLECNSIYANVSASGKITIEEVKASSSELGVRGSGDVIIKNANISGSAQLTVQGSGDVRIYGTVKRVRASVMGSGDIRGTINSDNVNATVMGSGDIDFSGRIKKHSQSVTGTGDIRIG